jgi:hypothetical protein
VKVCLPHIVVFGEMSQPQLYHEFGVTLVRNIKDEPWGLRLAGGSDLNSPLIVIRVTFIV